MMDTTGTVHFSVAYAKAKGLITFYRWADLNPFTQGYIEALFAEWSEGLTEVGEVKLSWPRGTRIAFSDLAPETLARIIADCERFKALGEREDFENIDNTRQHGARLWWAVNAEVYRLDGFPPLTVQLGDDGKVRFA